METPATLNNQKGKHAETTLLFLLKTPDTNVPLELL